MKRFIFSSIVLLAPFLNWAQCAMCRTQIKNNVSHGETEMAASLNNGIMFLFFAPYIVVGLVAFLWFRYSKVNERKVSIVERLRRQMS